MEHSPSSDNNRGGGDFFNKVDSILARTREHHQAPVGVLAWLEQAKYTANSLTTEAVLGGANTLLDEYPHGELSILLQLPHAERREKLEMIRRHRRLFLVARDGTILSTEKHYTEEYRSLRRLCFTLGQFADSAGVSELHAVTAHSSLSNLFRADKETEAFSHDNERLRAKYLVALDNMGVNELFHHNDVEHSFHQRRKNFRRAVNVLVLHAAQSDDEHKMRLAEEGLRINTAMGHISDSLEPRDL